MYYMLHENYESCEECDQNGELRTERTQEVEILLQARE